MENYKELYRKWKAIQNAINEIEESNKSQYYRNFKEEVNNRVKEYEEQKKTDQTKERKETEKLNVNPSIWFIVEAQNKVEKIAKKLIEQNREKEIQDLNTEQIIIKIIEEKLKEIERTKDN